MEPVREICDDCVKRFSCPFDAHVIRTSCGLYESDSDAVQYMIDCLSEYLKSKDDQQKKHL